MNKLFSMLLIVLLLPIYVNGQVITVNKDIIKSKPSSFFKLQLNEILEIKDIKDDVLNFSVTNVSENIDHWKLIVVCDKGVSILYESSLSNICDRAVNIESFRQQSFNLIFKNIQITDKFVNFSLRLKAYDKDDRWIQTEKKNFKWK